MNNELMIENLHYISQNPKTGTHLDAIEAVLAAGSKWVQLRIKDMEPAAILDFAKQAVALCEANGAKLIVNDYPEIAIKAGAYGVHLGLQDMPIREARAIVGANMIIGGTANTFEHILQRVDEGVDYIGLGPYRFTNTKQNLSPIIGLAGYTTILNCVREAGIQVPIIAIGGIVANDIPVLLQTGVYGVAISGALTNQTYLASLLQSMQLTIDSNSRHI
jgi:thiamine-phosphate pyrophosphorylase